jgi:hypothetical protein
MRHTLSPHEDRNAVFFGTLTPSHENLAYYAYFLTSYILNLLERDSRFYNWKVLLIITALSSVLTES